MKKDGRIDKTAGEQYQVRQSRARLPEKKNVRGEEGGGMGSGNEVT